MKVSIEARNVFKGFIDVVPEQPGLGGIYEPAIKPIEILKLPIYKSDVFLKQERGSERFKLKRGYKRGRRPRRVRGKRHRHPVGSSSCGPQCESGAQTFLPS